MGSRQVHVGLDLGKLHDPSAIVVAEILRNQKSDPATVPDGLKLPPHTQYHVQRIRRLPLGLDYPQQVAYVVKLLGALYEHALADEGVGHITFGPPALTIQLYADATGVGGPIIDLLRNAIRQEPRTKYCVHLWPITFAHGERYDKRSGRMGKAYMVSRVQALLQQKHIDLPAGDLEVDAMVAELKAYDIRVDQDGRDTYGAFKVGAHDDLATALGLAVLEDPAQYTITVGPRLF